MESELDLELRTDRACGACDICCRVLAIDDVALAKLPGVLCKHHAGQDKGCSIYSSRPETCRTFHCGWWFLPMGEEWRPDRCRILVVWDPANPVTGAEAGFRFHFFDGLDAIFWKPFVMCVANLASRNMPVYVSVPPPPGYNVRIGCLTAEPAFEQALAAHDFNMTVSIISRVIQSCIDGPKEPLRFRNA